MQQQDRHHVPREDNRHVCQGCKREEAYGVLRMPEEVQEGRDAGEVEIVGLFSLHAPVA